MNYWCEEKPGTCIREKSRAWISRKVLLVTSRAHSQRDIGMRLVIKDLRRLKRGLQFAKSHVVVVGVVVLSVKLL